MTTTTTTSQPGFASGGESAAGFKARIIAWCFDHGQEISSSKAQRLAVRIKRRADAMQEQFDFYESLRILGMTSDPTARDAVKHMEAA